MLTHFVACRAAPRAGHSSTERSASGYKLNGATLKKSRPFWQAKNRIILWKRGLGGFLTACIAATTCGTVAGVFEWMNSKWVGRIAQLVEQRTENPSSYHLKALQSVSFSNSIMKFYEGKFHF